jgi:cytochrome c-type biogenesis protein CcmH/NrfF
MRARPAPLVLALLVLALLAGPALWHAARREPDPGERAHEIAALLRCPDCQGVSAAESSSKLALSVRAEIERQLGEGRDQEAILEHFSQRYGDWILLSPPADGLPAVLWLLPVAALAVAAWPAVRRRRPRQAAAPRAGGPLPAAALLALGALALACGALAVWTGHRAQSAGTTGQPESVYRRGIHLVEAGRAAEAVSLLQPLVSSRPEDADLLLVLGTAQLVTDPPQGRRTLARFLRLAPQSHPAAARIRDLLR